MHSAVKSFFVLSLLSANAWAVEPAINTAPTTSATNPSNTAVASATPKPLTAEQIIKAKQQQEAKVKALIQDQANLLKQLEHANLEALSQNQELQLKNDSLIVQVQVLQSERSAQMFLYGAVTLGLGAFIGFLLANFILSKNKRRW